MPKREQTATARMERPLTVTFDVAKRQDGWPLSKVVSKDARGGYVVAEVMAVHAYECKSWRPSAPRHGWKCTCGADEAMESLMEYKEL